MFDAKLGNCVFYLGTTPAELPGFVDADAPLGCVPGGGVGGVVSYGKVEPHLMASLSEVRRKPSSDMPPATCRMRRAATRQGARNQSRTQPVAHPTVAGRADRYAWTRNLPHRHRHSHSHSHRPPPSPSPQCAGLVSNASAVQLHAAASAAETPSLRIEQVANPNVLTLTLPPTLTQPRFCPSSRHASSSLSPVEPGGCARDGARDQAERDHPIV
jgi:hypothetical protein